MRGRVGGITVATPNGDVVLDWKTGQTLIALLKQRAPDIAASVEAAGASRRVDLADRRTALRDLLGDWLADDDPLQAEAPASRRLLELYIALNRGEPHPCIVELWEESDAAEGPGLRSANWSWRWTQWRDRGNLDDDHQHCVFCHTNIEDDAVTEAWLTLGDDEAERWVCAGCFEQLRERFGWKVTQ